MRTTVIIDDSLGTKLQAFVSKRKLSELVNQCLREHFDKQERLRRLRELEKAYLRASKGKVSKEFEGVDIKDWPEW